MQDFGIGWWLRTARLLSSLAFVALALVLVQSLPTKEAKQSMR